MSRVQLALNVSDLDAAIDFYSKFFAAEPDKVRSGYANFAISEPPLKLVLIENRAADTAGATGALNHLGIEVETAKEVYDAIARLSGQGLELEVQDSTVCCYAHQTKVWVNSPDATPWEYYAVLADASEEVELGCGSESCAPGQAEPMSVETTPPTAAPAACC